MVGFFRAFKANINGMDSSIRVIMQLGPIRVVAIKLHGDVKHETN